MGDGTGEIMNYCWRNPTVNSRLVKTRRQSEDGKSIRQQWIIMRWRRTTAHRKTQPFAYFQGNSLYQDIYTVRNLQANTRPVRNPRSYMMKQMYRLPRLHCVHRVLIGLLCLAFRTISIWSPAYAHAVSFTYTVATDTAAKLFNNSDNDVGIVQTSSGLWVQASGTFGSPDYCEYSTEWDRYKGTTMDNLVQQPNSVLDSSFTQPNGDDKYWSSGVWQDARGIWYTPVHVEYSYGVKPNQSCTYPDHKRRIGLATSTDQGAHWHYQGDILTYDPNLPKPNPIYYNFGDGDLRLFVDSAAGYFYIYYLTGWTDPIHSQLLNPYMAVARSPIHAQMAPCSLTKRY